jgi:drug/metabolite transporter (DMT)-like permease
MKLKHQALWGYLFIVLAVTFWGASASLAKYLFTTRFDTVIISQMRTSLSFILLALFFAAFRRSVFRIAWKHLIDFILIGCVGIAATNFMYYYTIKESSVATAIIIQYTAPALVLVYAVFISKEERFNVAKIVSVVLSLIGCTLAVTGGSLSQFHLSGWSWLTGFGSAVTFAYMMLKAKSILRTYSIWTMLVYGFGFALILWLFVNPPWNIIEANYSLKEWGALWLFAIVSILIPHTLFYASLALLDATSVGIASTLEPVVAIIVAYVALGEQLDFVQIVGGVIVIGAVLLLQARIVQTSISATTMEAER